MVVSNICYFHPYWGSDLTNIFQMGWNHQLVILGMVDMLVCPLYCLRDVKFKDGIWKPKKNRHVGAQNQPIRCLFAKSVCFCVYVCLHIIQINQPNHIFMSSSRPHRRFARPSVSQLRVGAGSRPISPSWFPPKKGSVLEGKWDPGDFREI